jgi:tetratricopeptide (TPR) repeat protein
MKKIICVAITMGCFLLAGSQETGKSLKRKLLAELAVNACGCVDSISVYNKSRDEVLKEIHACIGAQTGAYLLGGQLADIDSLKSGAPGKDGKKQINIAVDLNENSQGYKNAYYDIEQFMMDSCASLKEKIAANDKQNEKSLSTNKKALDYYTKGIDESKKDNYKDAIGYFEKAVKNDPEFAFAWDNMGLCYRKAGDYDKALEAYKRSLEIDPNGLMPLQNIAVVYQYKKEYQQAINTYEKLALLDKNNPEVFYGMGQVYALNLNEYEKGLENICKAYNIYTELKSPYRTDAQKIIQIIYATMKKQGKEDKFMEILKSNNITAN